MDCVALCVALLAVFAVFAGGLVLSWFFDPIWRRWREFEAELAARESVSDEELFEWYFEPGEAAPDMPGQVRRVFADEMGYPADKLLPDEDLTFFWDEMDMDDLTFRLEKIFGIEITREDFETVPSCTIRAFTHLVFRKVADGR